jgi:penicillin amidase
VIVRFVAVLLTLIAAAIVAAVYFLFAPLPSRRGVVEIEGLTAPVEVRFDRAGIPHVTSVLEDDAWRALGWLHASERLFQMEMRRRAAAGRLAEVFGPALVRMDTEARTWGHLRHAQDDLAALSERERSVLEAYAQGVNAYLEHEPYPLELQALHLSPEPWTPADSLAFGRLMYQGLTIAAAEEWSVYSDAKARGVDAAVALFDASDGGHTIVAPEVREVLEEKGTVPFSAAEKGTVPFSDAEEAGAGSNAWALAGTRTASGKPLLAGDPHLNPERPAIWYAAHLTSADGLGVVGLTLAGVPGVIIGHNGKVAWSITMNQADDVDFVLERPESVSVARTETIAIANAPSQTLPIRIGPHGPIVDDLPGGVAVARAWVSEDLRHGIGFHLAAARARDGGALEAAWSTYLGPAINLCWADTAGSIGVSVFGAVPHRPQGNGRFPVPGWVAGTTWDGLVPLDALPSVQNPREGYVATANDDWSAAGIAVPYPGSFASSDRALRARELAGRHKRAVVADMRGMQSDVYSPYAARIVAALRTLPLTNERAVRARTVLAGWDARAERRGPSRLFFTFLRHVRASIPAAGSSGTGGAWVTWSLLERTITGAAHVGSWQRATEIEKALASALDEVELSSGKDPARWSWGRTHRLSYGHPLAAGLPPLLARRLLFRPVELPGEWHTLDVAGFRLDGEDDAVVHIPSARIIVDLASPDAARLALPLGQSGQILDRHARDQQRRWASVRDYPLPFTPDAVKDATISTMSFVPPH